MSITVNNDSKKTILIETSTPQNTKKSEGSSKPAIFTETEKPKTLKEGMTKDEARNAGLIDEFNKANVLNSKDNKITADELYKYNSDKNVTIIGRNIATAKMNDITEDLDTRIYNAAAEQIQNKKITGKLTEEEATKEVTKDNIKWIANSKAALIKELNIDPEKMDLTNAKKITAEQLKEITAITKQKLYVHAGMTRAEAEQKGGETLKYFNLISNGKDTIEDVDIAQYKKSQLEAKGIRVENILKTLQDTSDKEMQMKIYDAFINTMTDENSVREDFKEVKDLDGFRDKLGISKEEWEKAQTPEEKGKILAEAFNKIIQKDINFTDKKSRIYAEIKDIAQGHLTQDELDQGYTVGDKLSDNDLVKLAMGRIIKEYSSTIAHMSKTVFGNKDDSEKQAVVESLFGALADINDLRQVLESVGIISINDSQKRMETTNHVAKYETESGNFDASSITGAMVTSAIVQNGDEQTVHDFIVNNNNQVDVIQAVANSAVESMEDGDRKTALQEVVTNAVKTAETMNVENGSRAPTGGVKKTNSQPQQPVLNFNTPEAEEVHDIRKASLARYASNPIQNATRTTDEIEKQAKKQAVNLYLDLHIDPKKIEHMTAIGALDNLIKDFDRYPSHMKDKITNHFRNMKNDTQCLLYLGKSDTVRAFMSENKCIDFEFLFTTYLPNHPQEKSKISSNKVLKSELNHKIQNSTTLKDEQKKEYEIA